MTHQETPGTPDVHSVERSALPAAAKPTGTHTPGPWVMTVGEYAYVKGEVAKGVRKFILQRDHKQDKAEESARILADCRLIAAAPCLLAALQESIEDSEEVLNTRIATLGENFRPWRLKAMREQIAKGRAAIAKATGATL